MMGTLVVKGSKQLIKSPTRVTCSSSTLIDHASFHSKVFPKGAIDAGISDHQPIFCTRKISRFKQVVSTRI